MTYRVPASSLIFEQRLLAQTIGVEVFGLTTSRDVPITSGGSEVTTVSSSWRTSTVGDHTVTVAEHQTLFICTGGTLALPSTPAPFTALEYGFLCESGVTISGPEIIFGEISGTEFTGQAGAFVKLILIQEDVWLAYAMTGEWDLS